MNGPRVSVVIPAHDRAWALPECLTSVLEQTRPPYEVIVVDDRSRDDTARVVTAFAARGVRYARLEHGAGAQAARNLGVRLAQGDWIAFQDSDDLWLPDKLARQVAALRAAGGEVDVVVHGDGVKRARDTGRERPFAVPPTEDDCHAKLLLRPGPLFPALLVSKQALQEAGGLDENCPAYQEWDTALRLSRRCRFVHLREPLFVWIWHTRSAISKDGLRAVRGYRYVIERWSAEIRALHGERGWRRQVLTVVALALRAGLWDEARAMVDNEPRHRSFAFARWLVRRRMAPRGTGRVLRMLA